MSFEHVFAGFVIIIAIVVALSVLKNSKHP